MLETTTLPAGSAPTPEPKPERLGLRWDDLPHVTGCSLRTLQRYRREGVFPEPQRLGRVCVWSRDTVQRWLNGELPRKGKAHGGRR